LRFFLRTGDTAAEQQTDQYTRRFSRNAPRHVCTP
jgi:hypothetical protein